MKYIPESELKFVIDRKKVEVPQRGVLKQRLLKKLEKLKDENISLALSKMLSLDDRIEIAKNMLPKDLGSLEILFDEYHEEIEWFGERKEIIENVKKEMSITLNDKEVGIFKKYTDKGLSFKKSLDKIIKLDSFVTSRKLLRDKVRIAYSNTEKMFYSENKKFKPDAIRLFERLLKLRSIRFSELATDSRKKEILTDFYDRGIILIRGVSKKDFISSCRSEILKTKHLTNDYFPDIFPFEFEDKDENKMIRINPLHKKFQFTTKASEKEMLLRKKQFYSSLKTK